tara:strand:- start:12756 stop:13217 length:462 start_codon:yes stop_codon:yes gene_type:complete
MKKLTLTLFLLVSVVAFAQEEEKGFSENCSSLTMQGANNKSAFKDNIPFTGKCKSTNENNIVTLEKNYENGFLSGSYIVFYENGNPKEIIQYSKNLKHGKYLLYNQKNVLITEGNYKNNLKHGYWKTVNLGTKKTENLKKYNLGVEEKINTTN